MLRGKQFISLHIWRDLLYSEMSKLLVLPASAAESVEDCKKSVDNAVLESTGDKTKWVCKLFEEWKQNRLVRSCAFEILPQKTLKKEYKRWTPVITDM